MRKLLAILLITLLSLQAAWAAAASYCAHEQGGSAQHFGHHEHRHGQHAPKSGAPQAGDAYADVYADVYAEKQAVADGGSEADAAARLLAGADVDCGVCHAHAVAGMPSAMPAATAGALPGFTGALAYPQPLSVSLPGPERPNWHAA